MDPDTIEAFRVLATLALIIGGGCAITLSGLWAAVAGMVRYVQRREQVALLMPLYEAGSIALKPTVFNVSRLSKGDA